MDINNETGESTTSGRSPRFSMWVALTLFSIIVLGASVEVKNDFSDPDADIKWAVACSTVSLIFGAAVTLSHFLSVASSFMVGTMVEGGLAAIMAICWGCTVAVITDSDDEYAVDVVLSGVAGVSNANLYYFSWACFVTTIVIFVSYLRHAFGLDLDLSNRGARLNLWAALIATSLVVAGSSARALNDDCQDNGNSDLQDAVDGLLLAEGYCAITKFGIAVGTIGLFMAVGIVMMKTCLRTEMYHTEAGIAILAAILNGFGVAFITSNRGPGKGIGNLYYFSWASFLLSAFLVAECFGAGRQAQAQESGGTATENKDNGEFQEEDL